MLVVVGAVFFSCQKKEVPILEATPEPQIEETLVQECYQFSKGKDTINANLAIKGENVTGDLAYRFFEKDKSSGPVTGTLKGDTLVLEYTFQSEGSQSVRDVVYLRKNNTLIEGYGDIEEKDGKVIYKNKQQLQFTGTILNKIPCK